MNEREMAEHTDIVWDYYASKELDGYVPMIPSETLFNDYTTMDHDDRACMLEAWIGEHLEKGGRI